MSNSNSTWKMGPASLPDSVLFFLPGGMMDGGLFITDSVTLSRTSKICSLQTNESTQVTDKTCFLFRQWDRCIDYERLAESTVFLLEKTVCHTLMYLRQLTGMSQELSPFSYHTSSTEGTVDDVYWTISVQCFHSCWASGNSRVWHWNTERLNELQHWHCTCNTSTLSESDLNILQNPTTKVNMWQELQWHEIIGIWKLLRCYFSVSSSAQ